MISFVTLGTQPFTTVPNASAVTAVVRKADFMILSETQNNYFYYYLQENPLSQENLKKTSVLTDLDRVYDSLRFTILGKK